MARSINSPIMVYTTKDGRKALLWPKEYKKGDRLEILNYLKEMAKFVDEEKLKRSISAFEQWKKDPGFVV